MSKVTTIMSEPQLLISLAERYPKAEYALLSQVRNSTGFSRTTRTADAIALSLWPSRGLDLHGFEIKVSRNDWLRELKNPAKADEIASFCEYWWVVAGSESVVKVEELPTTWGLLVPSSKGLHAVKHAIKMEALPLSRSFVAAVMRRAADDISPTKLIEEARAKGKEDGIREERERATKRDTREADRLQAEVNQLNHVLKGFKSTSGIDLLVEPWRSAQIGQAVQFVRAGGLNNLRQELLRLQAQARNIANNIDNQLNSPQFPHVVDGVMPGSVGAANCGEIKESHASDTTDEG